MHHPVSLHKKGISSPAQTLLEFMQELCRHVYKEPWMLRAEVHLWYVINGRDGFGFNNLSDNHRMHLRRLAISAGGWVSYEEAVGDVVFVPMLEWRARHA
jgi:hypothetical protein